MVGRRIGRGGVSGGVVGGIDIDERRPLLLSR